MSLKIPTCQILATGSILALCLLSFPTAPSVSAQAGTDATPTDVSIEIDQDLVIENPSAIADPLAESLSETFISDAVITKPLFEA